MNLDPRELELRRSTYEWIRSKYDQDPAFPEAFRTAHATRREQAREALALVDDLRRSRDLATFRDAFDKLTSRKDSVLSLSGPNGQMVINMLANLSPDPIRGAEVLGRCIAVPSSDEEAAGKITELVGYFDEIRTGVQPQAGRAAPFLSVFWMLQDEHRWPARWATAVTTFDRLGWNLSSEPAQGYLDFAAVVRDLGKPIDVLGVLRWYSEVPWLGPDPTIERRIAWAREMREAGTGGSEAASCNADAMIAPLRQAGDDLGQLVGTALDRPVSKRMPPRTMTDKKVARYDAYVVWHPEVSEKGWRGPPGLRLWFSQAGVFIGLHPGARGPGWTAAALPHLTSLVPEGLEILTKEQIAAAAEPNDAHSYVLVGKLLPYSDYDWDRTTDLVAEVAEQALPLLQALLSDGPTWGTESTAPAEEVVADSKLAALFAEFVADWGYPRPSDVDQQSAREVLAALLSEQALPSIDVAEFRRVMNTSKYGFAGNRSILNVTLADPDEDAVQALVVDVVADLLYGPGTFEERLDRCPEQLKGLGQAGAMKLLAIVHPDRFLPIYPLTGAHGKLALLPLVGITEIPTGSPGERAVRANDLLRARLGSIDALAADPWGQMVFAYWLRDRETEEPDDGQDLDTRLAEATDRCTLPPGSPFLAELLGLLEDKGQIVLYGPPGTGKTYLALELAHALAPEEDRRALVQFHPSMAYEDFMEGFRPVLRDGNLTYELTKGPLVELADKAALDGRPHVLIIDEMNRANLPKVFGELLFLLEYRDHPVKLAYRTAEDTFALPKNLWIIGTMNLADRSVGQIDAALRRRFAFVPFTPSDEHNGGLLRRWLTKVNLPVWPADVVDEVNTELENDLGHADLLIGPSYFMKPSLDEAQMAVIWRYAIEPLMSDLFHGDQKLVQKYGWELVRKRHAALMPGAADVSVTPMEAAGE